MNRTGVIVGRLTKEDLKELIVNYAGSDRGLRRKLVEWFGNTHGLAEREGGDKLGLIISLPIPDVDS